MIPTGRKVKIEPMGSSPTFSLKRYTMYTKQVMDKILILVLLFKEYK